MQISVILHILALASATITSAVAIPLPGPADHQADGQASPAKPSIQWGNTPSRADAEPGRPDGATAQDHGYPVGSAYTRTFNLEARLADFKDQALRITNSAFKDRNLNQIVEKMERPMNGIVELASDTTASSRVQAYEELHPGALSAASAELKTVMAKVHELQAAVAQKNQQKRKEVIGEIATLLEKEYWLNI